MRLSVTAFVLACASCIVAQTEVVDTPAQEPTAVPQTPIQPRRGSRAASPGTVPGNVKNANVPPSTAVVTLQGVCNERQAKSNCKTVITRNEFDSFVSASAAEVSETARGRLTVQYARTLAFSALAEQQGLEKDPVVAKELEVQLRLVRMRILSNALLQNLRKQPTSVAEAEVRKYFDGHRDQYEQAQVLRLAVPIAVPTESGRPLDRSVVKSEMEKLRSRAVAGEDLAELQRDAYTHLHIQATPPPVNVLTLRRDSVQGDETKAFDLNPGEISALLELPAAFAVIKLESKGPMPLESVRQEIEATLRRDHMQNEISQLTRRWLFT